MKRLFILLLIGFSSIIVFSQDTLYFYFDKNWKETQKFKAVYYRKAYKNIFRKWIVTDYFRDNDQVQMTGVYKDNDLKIKDGYFKYYNEFGTLESEGNYIIDNKDGDWKFYNSIGEIRTKSKYKNGKFLELTYKTKDGREIITYGVDSMPDFPGGNDGLFNFLRKNIVYPLEARHNGTHGIVRVQFVVNEDGSVSDAEIETAIGSGCDEEALRVVNLMPKWKPVILNNKPVKVFFVLPVKFTLN